MPEHAYLCVRLLQSRVDTKSSAENVSVVWLKTSNSVLQKKLDFTLKVIGGDISAIPGLSDAIEVWPTVLSWCCY